MTTQQIAGSVIRRLRWNVWAYDVPVPGGVQLVASCPTGEAAIAAHRLLSGCAHSDKKYHHYYRYTMSNES